MIAASFFGRFGSMEPKEEVSQAIIKGLHKFQEGRVSHKKRGKFKMRHRSGYGGHRRTYLTGKTWIPKGI